MRQTTVRHYLREGLLSPPQTISPEHIAAIELYPTYPSDPNSLTGSLHADREIRGPQTDR